MNHEEYSDLMALRTGTYGVNERYYIVWNAEDATIVAADKTLTEACRLRDSLMTLGDPRVAVQAAGDREGGSVDRPDRGMATL